VHEETFQVGLSDDGELQQLGGQEVDEIDSSLARSTGTAWDDGARSKVKSIVRPIASVAGARCATRRSTRRSSRSTATGTGTTGSTAGKCTSTAKPAAATGRIFNNRLECSSLLTTYRLWKVARLPLVS
jgi:hypothetical protein